MHVLQLLWTVLKLPGGTVSDDACTTMVMNSSHITENTVAKDACTTMVMYSSHITESTVAKDACTAMVMYTSFSCLRNFPVPLKNKNNHVIYISSVYF